ncbi:MAG: radical SAM protein [Armatimonadota bacterium]|nr:MAG: radical SAM protein [Armatimonadota bacterium]
MSELKKVVYGPVPSWRLGRSLGIDLLSRAKTCSFDCIYCQLGPTRQKTVQRSEFVATTRVLEELTPLPSLKIDYVTFSGTGEPTLASNLGEAIVEAGNQIGVPAAVLTNSSLITDPQVRGELALADFVVAKLDAPDEGMFHIINRPADDVRFEAVLDGLRRFRQEYQGRLAIQVMFCPENRECAGDIAALLSGLKPDEVQINTPLRPCPVTPLPAAELAEVARAFAGTNVVTVYESRRPAVRALDASETARRRPE